MPNGIAIRRAVLRNARGTLGRDWRTTAAAGGTDRLRDAIRHDSSINSVEDIAGAQLRIGQAHAGTATASAGTTLTDSSAPFVNAGLPGALVVAYTAAGATTVATITSNTTTVLTASAGWSNGTPSSTSAYIVTYEHVARVVRVDPSNGDIYFDPAVTTAVATNTYYEVWYQGILADETDQARDDALQYRCSPKLIKPLSILTDVEDWLTTAYDATTGGVTDAAAVPAALDFPEEIFAEGMTVTNSGADGILSSRRFRVQPNEQYRVWGRVSVGAQTASVRVRDLTNSADITLNDTDTYTLDGWQWFDKTFTIPADCGRAQVWLGGASASCVATWAGVGLLPTDENWLSLNPRIISKHDIGRVWQYMLPKAPNRAVYREELQLTRELAGDGASALADTWAPGAYPCYYQERHRFDALQSDYMSLVHRATGSGTNTTCPVQYVAWATVVELLEARERNTELERCYQNARKQLTIADRRYGFDPFVAPEFPRSNTSGIPVLRL